MLWRELNSQDIIPVVAARHSLVHRNLDVTSLEFEPEEDFSADQDVDDSDVEYDEDDDFYYEE
jgi:GTP-binding protein